MTAAAIVLAVLLVVALLRVGVHAEFGDGGLKARAYFGPVRLTLLPRGEKKKPKPPKEPKKKPDDGEKKPGLLSELKKQLPGIKKALSRLRRRLLINELTVHYLSAGDDPAAAAIRFGAVSAGYGVLLPLLERSFRIKKRDLRTAVDFNASEPQIYVGAHLSLAVWEVFYIAFGLLIGLLADMKLKRKIGKAV